MFSSGGDAPTSRRPAHDRWSQRQQQPREQDDSGASRTVSSNRRQGRASQRARKRQQKRNRQSAAAEGGVGLDAPTACRPSSPQEPSLVPQLPGYDLRDKIKTGPAPSSKKAGRKTRRAPPKVPRQFPCPIPDCVVPNKYTKLHAFELHVPDVFAEYRPEGDISRLRLAALTMLGDLLLGNTGTLEKLSTYVTSCGLLSKQGDVVVTPVMVTCMRALCRELHIDPPQVFTLDPLNSPAALSHWKVVNILVGHLTPFRREEFLRAFPVRSQRGVGNADQAVDDYEPEAVGGHRYVDPTMEEEQLPEVAVPVVPEAFDSHFHMDRTREYWGLEKSAGFREVCAVVGQLGGHEVLWQGAVANFCDPDTWPTLQEIKSLGESGVWVTVGWHPKRAHLFTESRFRQLKELSELPEVLGVGEIGYDHTLIPDRRIAQQRVLGHVLPLIAENYVLVLHCRGPKGSKDQSSESYMGFRFLLKAVLQSKDQKIHLHCITGNANIVKQWLDVFPRTYFGFTNLVRSFGPEQIEALQAVPDDRLVIETDAPYFPVAGWKDSAPSQIGFTAGSVAERRGGSRAELLSLTTDNGKTLYSGWC
jgi:TatD DNase family protein